MIPHIEDRLGRRVELHSTVFVLNADDHDVQFIARNGRSQGTACQG